MYARLLDVTVSLAMAAAVTTRLRLGTSVLLLTARDPLWTAKAYATLDALSGGRVECGVGFGWNREELANHGVRFAEWADGWMPISARPSLADRLARLDEWSRLLDEL